MDQQVLYSEKLIMIVDDNPMNLMLTSKILEGFGYNTITAESGFQALSLLENIFPLLILLDISMPSMDGYEVCEQIKKNPKWTEIPIIFLTANAQTENLIKGFEKGGVDYITKPFKSEELEVRVKTHLELYATKKEIVNINRQRDKLYSIIAHDIRSPLSGILQTIDAIEQGYFDPSSEDFKVIIHHLRLRANDTNALLNSLLQWSGLTNGQLTLNPKHNNVNMIVRNCIQLLSDSANNKRIQINLHSETEFEAWCDEVSIHTVIRNLLSNAIKFTPQEGEINVTIYTVDDNTCVKIRDNGVGMSEETLRQLFVENVHLTTTGTNNEQGVGLGMILVKDFIEKNNGSVRVVSELGKGSSFQIALPSHKAN